MEVEEGNMKESGPEASVRQVILAQLLDFKVYILISLMKTAGAHAVDAITPH